MKTQPDPHFRHLFPAGIISHAAWLYHVFSLSLRDVELIPGSECVHGGEATLPETASPMPHRTEADIRSKGRVGADDQAASWLSRCRHPCRHTGGRRAVHSHGAEWIGRQSRSAAGNKRAG